MAVWQKVCLVFISVVWVLIVAWMMMVPACLDDPILRLIEFGLATVLLPWLFMGIIVR